MNPTPIEYLTHTWNPLAMRCSRVSEGCRHCWHIPLCDRFAANPIFSTAERDAYAGGEIVLRRKELAAPMTRTKPARIGVQFMGDLFHEDVPVEYIDKVFAVMALCPQHTFQVLTKRHVRALEYLTKNQGSHKDGCIPEGIYLAMEDTGWQSRETILEYAPPESVVPEDPSWPLPNVWGMVTAENQDMADKRVPILLQCPFAVRGVSVEPMLGPVSIREHLPAAGEFAGWFRGVDSLECGDTIYQKRPTLDWVIIGCESGPNRRPCKLEWVRDLAQECRASRVACFVKQVDLGGRVSKDPAEWPEDVRVREYPR